MPKATSPSSSTTDASSTATTTATNGTGSTTTTGSTSSGGGDTSTTAPPTIDPAPTTPTNPGIPTPPSTAKVFSNLQQRTGWESCNAAGCAGGSGTGTYWMAQSQASPSLSGSSAEIYNQGSWANALWWNKLGAVNTATNFLWDFYFQVDSQSLSSGQALEFDDFQFIGGYNYMMGTECSYASGYWDLWDEYNGHWIRSTVPCSKFTAGTWHHIQLYTQTTPSAHTYTFVTLVVDGVSYSLNKTYSAKYLAWGDEVGAQYQLDVNASGTGYREWFDNSTLTAW